MFVELSILLADHNAQMSAEPAKTLQLVDASGPPYQLTPLCSRSCRTRLANRRLWRHFSANGERASSRTDGVQRVTNTHLCQEV